MKPSCATCSWWRALVLEQGFGSCTRHVWNAQDTKLKVVLGVVGALNLPRIQTKEDFCCSEYFNAGLKMAPPQSFSKSDAIEVEAKEKKTLKLNS